MKATQNVRIMEYLDEYGSITQKDATEKLGVARLASRINDLRKNGVVIITNRETGENRWGELTTYARYWLVR